MRGTTRPWRRPADGTSRTTTRRTVLAASGSLVAVGLAGCLGDDNGDDENGDDAGENGDDSSADLEIETFELLDRDHDEDVIAYVHDDHWDHGPLVVPVDDHVSVGAHVEDADGDDVELGDGIDLEAEITDGSAEIVDVDSRGDHVHLEGSEEGFTDVVFQLLEDETVVYESPELEVEVGDGEQEYVDENGHDGEH